MADAEAAQILPGVSALKRSKVLRALRDVSAIPRRTMDADTRRAATRLLQAASPLRHRMVRNTRELLRRCRLLVPKRDPREVVEMTPAESALYTAVEDFIGDVYRAASPEKRSAVGFVMTVYRRRLASSFEALKRTLNVPCSKEEIKRRLRDRQVRLLVCTDAAGEGLNLQFAGVLVNYDLPWNPMKVEQRIGRIDRLGQPRPVVRILSFAYKDTVEQDVFFTVGNHVAYCMKLRNASL